MSTSARISETQLILPSLFIMDLHKGSVTTSVLIPELRKIMRPTGEDAEILAGRTDDKFSQKVRNLKAHSTFERYGYAAYDNGFVSITEEGRAHLEQNRDILAYLLKNDFSYPDLKENLEKIETNKGKKKIEVFDENVMIQEGLKSVVEAEIYQRSKALRDYALQHFKDDEGRISCASCSFNFADFYGADLGKDFIEIHHVKPIFKYEGSDLTQTLREAVKNLMPVCSNCHRMIHRNWSKPLELQVLMDGVNGNGVFRRFMA